MAQARTHLMKSRLALVVAIGLLIWLLPRPETVDPRAWRLLAIFIATLVGIIAKPLPMSAVAIVGIAAALATRTLTIAESLTGFSNITVWLVISAFFFAAGFVKTGLGTRIAYMLIARFGRSSLGLATALWRLISSWPQRSRATQRVLPALCSRL